jgi:hypothetical protein
MYVCLCSHLCVVWNYRGPWVLPDGSMMESEKKITEQSSHQFHSYWEGLSEWLSLADSVWYRTNGLRILTYNNQPLALTFNMLYIPSPQLQSHCSIFLHTLCPIYERRPQYNMVVAAADFYFDLIKHFFMLWLVLSVAYSTQLLKALYFSVWCCINPFKKSKHVVGMPHGKPSILHQLNLNLADHRILFCEILDTVIHITLLQSRF